jgi:hypothetical protein
MAVGLLIVSSTVGCNPPKEGEFSQGGGSGGDTGTSGGSGDTGDTGAPSDPPPDTETTTNVPARCALQAVTNANFGTSLYATGSPGHECLCEMDYVHDGTGFPEDNQLWMWVRGDGDNSSLGRPSDAAFEMSWGGTLNNDGPTNHTRPENWEAQQFQAFDDPDALDGTYSFWLSEKRSNGAFDDACDSHAWRGGSGQVQVEIGFKETSAPPPSGAPPRPQAPGGYEDDMDCTSNATATTTFELLDVPHKGLVAPIPVDGSPAHVGADAVTIEVLDWRGADELTVEGPSQSVLIEPGDGEVTLPTGDWWVGSVVYRAHRKDSAGTFKNPLIRIDHACPATPAGPTETAAAGYGLSLQDLADAVEDATGWTSLADILLDAPQPTWDVYAVRMVDIDRPAPLANLPALRLEFRGTDHALLFPMTSTGTDTWSFDYAYHWYDAVGTVTRSGTTLTLSVTSGVLHSPNGDVTMTPFTLSATEL